MGWTAAEYVRMWRNLMPRGHAWTRDGDSVWATIHLALSQELERLDVRTENLLDERDTRTTEELIEEHEYDLGLPQTWFPSSNWDVDRNDKLHAKLIRKGKLDKGYYIALAAEYGYTITITEFDPYVLESFRLAPLGPYEESEPQGSYSAYVWLVTIWFPSGQDFQVVPFRAGEAQSGDAIERVPCVLGLRRLFDTYKPAHTRIVFSVRPEGPGFSSGFDNGFDSVTLRVFLLGIAYNPMSPFSLGFDLGFDQSAGFEGTAFDAGFARNAMEAWGFDWGFDMGFGHPSLSIPNLPGGFERRAFDWGFDIP